jgi:hypothetical protein
MIKISSPVQVGTEPSGGWQITLWVGVAFDYSTPFRSILAEIAGYFEPKPVLELPPFQKHEDFIEGHLHIGELSLKTYYEHALGYLAIMGENEHDLSHVLIKLQPHVALANDL